MIIILLAASALSAATGDVLSFVVIASIVLLSISFDFVQEMRAQNAVEALRRSVAVQATVRRDGRAVSLPIDRLVPASDAAHPDSNPTGASNAVFSGTSIISGTALVLVCRTGAKTALGALAISLARSRPRPRMPSASASSAC